MRPFTSTATLTSLLRLTLAVVVLVGSGALQKASAEERKKKATLSVYFPDYRLKKAGSSPEFYGTTHLILFSAKPNEDGSVDFSRITPAMLAMASQAREAGNGKLKITFCVGGWGRGKLFANAVASPEKRERFAAALTEFCDTHQLDGVDIDWEFPKGDEEHAHFTAFLKILGTKLRAESRMLSVALGETRPLTTEAYTHIDQVNLMSYQPWNPQPYEVWLEKAVLKMLDSGLPSEKLNLGVGFYAKEMGGKRRAFSWSKLTGKDKTPLPESTYEFSPVGLKACDLRLALVKKHNLGGVMVWDWGHDSLTAEDSLLKYLSDRIDQ